MPEKNPKGQPKKDIRSMRDAVSEVRSFAENGLDDEDGIRKRNRFREEDEELDERPRKARKKTDEDDFRESAKKTRRKREGGEEEAPEQRRRVRNMREAVDELRGLNDEAEDKPSRDHSETDRDSEVYGGGRVHSAESAEKSPKAPSEVKKKKKNSFVDRLLRSGKRIRHGKGDLTLFGHKISFWPVFIAFFVFLMLLVFLLNSTNLVVDMQDVTLMGLPGDLEGYRILVLSDLNGKRFGDRQTTLLRQIDSLNYDMVLCLGDMVGKKGDPEPFYELLEGLPASKKVYFVCGDSDPGPYADQVRNETAQLDQLVLHDWILGAEKRGATYLDSTTQITVGSASLYLTPTELLNLEISGSMSLWKDQTAQEESGYLAGIETDAHSLPFTSYRYQISQRQMEAYNVMDETNIHLAVGHVPTSESYLRAACSHSALEGKYLPDPDLVLAAHYCGGVWNLPLLGAFYVPDSTMDRYGWFPAQENVSGLKQIDDMQRYITRGLSNCGDTPLMPFRLLNSPEISLLTLTATLPTNMLD